MLRITVKVIATLKGYEKSRIHGILERYFIQGANSILYEICFFYFSAGVSVSRNYC